MNVAASTIIPPSTITFFSSRSYLTHSITFPITTLFPTSAPKCKKNGNKDVLSGIVGESVEELLNKPENKGLLDGLEQAARRVEMAKRELAKIEQQEIEADSMREYVNQLESRAFEIAECQKEILEARAMVKEAEQSLTDRSREGEAMTKYEERLESLKAAMVSAAVGTLAELPITLTRATSYPEMILPLAITFVNCALFGVTFRYAVRRDLDNFNLKSGTSFAFGLVKGLAMSPPILDVDNIVSYASNAATCVSESVVIFLFAGVALDYCMKLRFISPFPMDPTT